MLKSNLNTALLFLVFNRPSCTKKVFDVIKVVLSKPFIRTIEKFNLFHYVIN